MAAGTGKSGQQVAEEHVQALIAVLAAYGERPLPRFHGEVNRSAIAAECGFDRKVLTANPRCAELLARAEEADGLRHLNALQQAEGIREERAKVDRDRLSLEARVLELQAENARLRAEVGRFRAIEAVMLATGKLP